jgi:hypothetical protein
VAFTAVWTMMPETRAPDAPAPSEPKKPSEPKNK